jgi:hypothetical protein
MKKILNLFASIACVSIASSEVVACSGSKETTETIQLDYYDDRTYLQKQAQEKIEQERNAKNPNGKKVILLGYDGIDFNQAQEKLFNDVDGIKMIKDYAIQNYESVHGWNSILFGNILKDDHSIFGVLPDLKTGMVSDWVGLGRDILNENENRPTNWYDFVEEVWGGYSNVHEYDSIEDIQERTGDVFEKTKEMIQDNDFIFQYDVFADEEGHSGFDYDTDMVNATLNDYHKNIEYYFDSNNFDPKNTLVIGVTDHGRNTDGLVHTYEDTNNRRSWMIANQDVDQFLTAPNEDNYTRHLENFYDIKEIVYNYLKA